MDRALVDRAVAHVGQSDAIGPKICLLYTSTTSDGFYYIVQVEDRKKATVTSLEDVRAQIEQTVISEQSQIRQQNWLDSLRAKAFIKMFL